MDVPRYEQGLFTVTAAMQFGSRPWRRRTWFGLMTALGLAERGFFIPYRHAGSARPKGGGLNGGRPSYRAVEDLFDGKRADFEAVLAWLDPLRDDLLRIGDEPAPAPRWTQDWFPRLDAAVAYAMVRQERPARILEVGSGHSTRFLLRALADGDAAAGIPAAGKMVGGNEAKRCSVTAIDPAPRATLTALERDGQFTLQRTTLQAAGLAPFAVLEDGDFLLIDSSHILMPGSDVDLLFGHLLPTLPEGLLLHIHDVFLPDDYPADWAWRGYNEQLAVLPLLFGGGWEVVFASHYVASRMADVLAETPVGQLPLSPGAHESGLWLRKCSPALGAAA